MALITDPDLLAQGTEVSINTGTRRITLNETGDLSADGVTLQALYSFLKEEWKDDSLLIPHPFPMVAITPEQFEFVEDWELVNDADRKLIRTGGWREYDEFGILKREWVGIVTLGTFEDDVNDTAYFQTGADPTDTGAATNFTYAGPVNEPVKTFEELASLGSLNFNSTSQLTRSTGSWISDGFRVGSQITIRLAEDSQNNGTFTITALSTLVLTVSGTPFLVNAADTTARVAYNHRNAVKLFLRVRDGDTNGKTYSQAKLSDIGVTTLDNKVFRFPLSNATDLKVSETDANITSNSPYTQIVARYFDQAFTRNVESGTGRNFGICIDVGTHSAVDGSCTATGTVLTSSEGGIVDDARYEGGTLIIHEGTNAGTYTIDTGAGAITATTVTITGGTFPNTVSNQSFTLYRATPIVATAEEIYEKVQYLLRQASDVDSTDQTVTGKTADALLTFVGDTLVTGRAIPTNPNGGGTGVIIEGFDANDTNRLVFTDNSAVERTYPYVATGTINFNSTLVADTGPAKWWMFFEYTERFTNTGFSIGSAAGSTATLGSTTTNLTSELTASGMYINLEGFATEDNNGIWMTTAAGSGAGPYSVPIVKVDGETAVNESAGPAVSLDKNPINSPSAIIVNDADAVPLTGTIGGPSVSFTFDYDGNSQGGRSIGTDAAIVLRAIGLGTAQNVETAGTILRATNQSFSLVAGLERNYSNP